MQRAMLQEMSAEVTQEWNDPEFYIRILPISDRRDRALARSPSIARERHDAGAGPILAWWSESGRAETFRVTTEDAGHNEKLGIGASRNILHSHKQGPPVQATPLASHFRYDEAGDISRVGHVGAKRELDRILVGPKRSCPRFLASPGTA